MLDGFCDAVLLREIPSWELGKDRELLCHLFELRSRVQCLAFEYRTSILQYISNVYHYRFSTLRTRCSAQPAENGQNSSIDR